MIALRPDQRPSGEGNAVHQRRAPRRHGAHQHAGIDVYARRDEGQLCAVAGEVRPHAVAIDRSDGDDAWVGGRILDLCKSDVARRRNGQDSCGDEFPDRFRLGVRDRVRGEGEVDDPVATELLLLLESEVDARNDVLVGAVAVLVEDLDRP